MKKNNLLSFVIILICSLFLGVAAHAADDTIGSAVIAPPVVNLPAATAENAPASLYKESRLSKLIAIGTMRINERTTSLNKIKTKISSSKVLTTDQIASLNGLIDQNISGLNDLLTKIKADADVKILRSDVQSIYTSFRIYAVFIPKVNSLIALNTQTNHALKLSDRFVKVQSRIDAAKAKGKNVDTRQNALDAAKSTLESIKTKVSLLVDQANSLKASDYPTVSKTTIGSVRTGIKDVQKMFLTINADLKIAK